ncbi:MAG: HTTM domain-containing protein, partial [bacterium]
MRRKLDTLFAIDFRALAFFRVAAGAIVLIDLLGRGADLGLHYTAAGVLPLATLEAFFPRSSWAWSLHYYADTAFWQGALFLFQAFAAACLVVGYRTRLATFLTWLLLASLQARNPMVKYGADDLLRLAIFWSMFLPLGALWSVDSRRRRAGPPMPRSHLSAASAAILLQVCVMYIFSGLLKLGPEWQWGEALAHALSFEMYATPLARMLATHADLVAHFGALVPRLELVAACLLFVPLATARWRVLALVLLAGFHLTTLALLAAGIFPFVALACLSLFLPAAVWDALEDMAFRLRERRSPAPRTEQPERSAPGRGRGWVPVATNVFVGLLFLYVVAWNVVGLGLEDYTRNHRLEWVEEHWQAGGKGLPVMTRDDTVARMLGGLGWVGRVAALEQRWDMFYRASARGRGWHMVVGTQEDGQRISLLTGGRMIDEWPPPRPEDGPSLYPNARWRVLFTFLRASGLHPLRERLAAALHA